VTIAGKRLKPGQPLPYDLVLAGGGIHFRKGTIITDEILRIIKEGKVTQVNIEAPIASRHDADNPGLFDHISQSHLSQSEKRLKRAYHLNLARSAIRSHSGLVSDPFSTVHEKMASMWKDPSQTLDLPEIMTAVEKWISLILEKQNCLTAIGWVKESSAFLPGHMVNTAKFASCLAAATGVESDHLREITLSALLHDIGEMFIEREILTSKKTIDPSHLNRIRQHPRQSVEWLKRSGINQERVHKLVLRHHERFDGTGYPYNITGKVLHSDDILIAISDVYIALISKRPYREALSRREALRTIMRMKGGGFPGEMIAKMVGILGMYPPGSLVGLKSGGIAVILAPPSDGKWPGFSISDENNNRRIEQIDLNHLSGDYIIKEYA
jgi:HD-GYP domain-containing protein (c-di-GMP phosphodiesterase class II)